MRSHESLAHWTAQLLPAVGATVPVAARGAAKHLLRSLLLGYTTSLSQLARQLDRPGSAKQRRQYLRRWLNHPAWDPEQLQTRLGRCTRRLLHHLAQRGDVLILIDATTLSDGWLVLQAAVAWQRRALPLYRTVTRYAAPEETLPELVGRTLAWLARHLPGPRRRYVLVLDRGFPSHPLVEKLRREGWRYVMRIKGNWKLHHPQFTGQVRDLPAAVPVGATPQLLRGGWWGQPQASRHCTGSLVAYQGEGHQEPWYLLTSEGTAAQAVTIYRQRMQIEQEFRDLKGPEGLDHLATWTQRARVERLLAWIAVYEWRLAYLWLVHQLGTCARDYQVGGKLSWLKTTQEWLRSQLRSAVPLLDNCL
jgi:hypothetical protein